MIRMPLIETEIQAACHTEGELAHEIAARYAKYYKNLQVDVFIKEYYSIQVAIIGSLKEKTRFELQCRYRLLELVTHVKSPYAITDQSIHFDHSTATSPVNQED